jgi:hypothetical protein
MRRIVGNIFFVLFEEIVIFWRRGFEVFGVGVGFGGGVFVR